MSYYYSLLWALCKRRWASNSRVPRDPNCFEIYLLSQTLYGNVICANLTMKGYNELVSNFYTDALCILEYAGLFFSSFFFFACMQSECLQTWISEEGVHVKLSDRKWFEREKQMQVLMSTYSDRIFMKNLQLIAE